MSDSGPDQLSADVVAAFANTPDPRLREIMGALVRHLHAFAREVELTPEEWHAGVEFLAAAGRISTAQRSEFILLSDTLGLSMRVVALAQARAGGASGATEATVEGPFYRPGAPELALGSDIGAGVSGEPALYSGRVTDCDGRPIAGAVLDVWSSDGEGRYDLQLAGAPMQARGRFRSDDQGRYGFWSIRPAFYPVPDDGPVGAMLRATGRGIHRPAHLHLQVSAPGHATLTTHLFVAGSPHLDDDAVFGTRASLVVDFVAQPPGRAADGREMAVPYHAARFDVRLAPAAGASVSRSVA